MGSPQAALRGQEDQDATKGMIHGFKGLTTTIKKCIFGKWRNSLVLLLFQNDNLNFEIPPYLLSCLLKLSYVFGGCFVLLFFLVLVEFEPKTS